MNSDSGPRRFAEIVTQAKHDLKIFLYTRGRILACELREKRKALSLALVLAGIAILLLVTAYLLFVASVLAFTARLLRGTSSPVLFACLIVAGVTALLGVIAASIATTSLKTRRILPTKTIAVLKSDGAWLQTEMENRL